MEYLTFANLNQRLVAVKYVLISDGKKKYTSKFFQPMYSVIKLDLLGDEVFFNDCYEKSLSFNCVIVKKS